jgi:hypothetical protein
MKRFDDSLDYIQFYPEIYIKNPLNNFFLMKHLTVDIENLISQLKMSDELKEFLAELKQDYVVPNVEDYYASMEAIYEIQDVYEIAPKTLINADLHENYPSLKLKSKYFFKINKKSTKLILNDYLKWKNALK